MWTGTKGRFGLKYAWAEQTAEEAAEASMERMAAAKVEGPDEGRHRGGAADVSLSSLNDGEEMTCA